MATKNNDPCRDKAADNEPVFTLRGQDKLAGPLVRLWADLASVHGCDIDKLNEAINCAKAMDEWAEVHGKWPD